MNKIIKNIIRVIVGILLILLSLYVILWVFPLSFDSLNKRTSRIIENATGLQLSTKKTLFYVSQGEIYFDEPLLINPIDKSAPPIRCDSVAIEFDWSNILFTPTKIINSITIKNLYDVELAYDASKINKELIINKSLDISRITKRIELKTGENVKTKYLIRNFKLYNLSLTIRSIKDTISTAKSPAAPEPLPLRLKRVNLDYSYDMDEDEEKVTIYGYVGVNRLTKFASMFSFSSNRTDINYRVIIENFTNFIPFNLDFPFYMSGKQLLSTGTIFINEEDVNFITSLSFSNFYIKSKQDNFILPYSSPVFTIYGNYIPVNKKVVISDAHFTILNSDFITSDFFLELDHPFKYKFNFDISNLSEMMANLIKDQLVYNGIIADVKKNAVHLHIQSEGELDNLINANVSGDVTFNNISFKPASFKTQINSISGALSFDRNSVTVNKLHLITGKNDVTISSKFIGDIFTKKLTTSSFVWDASVNAKEVFDYFNQGTFPLLRGLKMSGIAKASGSAVATFDEKKHIKNVTTDQVLILSDFSLSHPALPFDADRTEGKLIIKDNIVKLNNIKTEVEGISCLINGTSQGKMYFFSDPFIDVSISASGNVKKAIDTIYKILKEAKEKQKEFSVTGDIMLNAFVKGALFKFKELNVSSEFILRNGNLQFGKPYIGVPLENVYIETKLNSQGVVIPKYRLRAARSLINGEGSILLKSGIFTKFSADGYLENAKAAFPLFLHSYEMNGKANADFEFYLSPKKPLGIAETKIAAAAVENVYTITVGDMYTLSALFLKWFMKVKDELDLQFKGEISSDRANFKHKNMPHFMSGSGKITITDKEIIGEGIKADFGGAKNCIVSGKVIHRGKNPSVDLTIKAPQIKIDDYIVNWGGYDSHTKYTDFNLPVPPHTDNPFRFTADVSTDYLMVKELRSQNVKAKLEYIYDKTSNNNSIKCNDYSGDFYNGQLKGDILFQFTEKPVKFTSYCTFKDVNMNTFLKDYLPHKRDKITAQGVAAGFMSLKGNGVKYNTYFGDGKIDIAQSTFFQNKLFKGLGVLLNINTFDKISFTNITSTFRVENGYIESKDMQLKNPMLDIQASGRSDFDTNLDFDIRVNFAEGIVGNVAKKIPILKNVIGAVDEIASILIQTHLGGNLDNPKHSLKPIPQVIKKVKNLKIELPTVRK